MRQVLALAALLLLASTARADAMRCRTRLVPDGATLEQTLSTCGAPTSRDHYVDHVKRGQAGSNGQVVIYEQDVVVDVLRYDFGRRDFVYELVFRDGQMVSMQKGERGKAR